MRILLIYLSSSRSRWPRGKFRSRWVPTGVAYIAAALRRAGHSVRILNRVEQAIKNDFDWAAADAQLQELLRDFRPEIVGLSVVTSSMPEAACVAQLVKELCGKNVIVVAGGPHPTALPEQTLEECPAIDVIVIGEGEQTMVELAAKGPTETVAGILFRKDGTLIGTPPRLPQQDLDSLGPPAYDLLDMKFYTTPTRWMIRWLPFSVTNVSTNRGCPGRCRFCAGHLVSGLGVRYHSVDYIIEQVRHLVERFGVNAIHFEADTIGTNRAWLIGLCEALCRHDLQRRICWDSLLRVDQVNAELLEQMKSAGCIQIEYGFESASDEALRRLGKRTTSDLNRRAVRLTREAGLRVFADIMVGLPGETEADFKATVDFLRWAKPEVISAAHLAPLPGTPIYDDLPKNIRDSLNWADYAYLNWPGSKMNLTAMSNQRFEALCHKFEKYFLRPATISSLLRDMPSGDADYHRRLRRRLTKFIAHHPLRAARLPCKGILSSLLRRGQKRPRSDFTA